MKTSNENFEALVLPQRELHEIDGGKIKLPTWSKICKAGAMGLLVELVANFRHAREGFIDGADGDPWKCDTCKYN